MKREYTIDQYRQLVGEIRKRIPGVSIATDVIVGFPGETREQFQVSCDVLKELKLDVAHLARYSVRPGTVAARKIEDDVSEDEKWSRFRLLEELQEGIAAEINQKYLTGLLNSKLINFWLYHKGKRQGEQLQIDKAPLLEIPLINKENEQVIKNVDLLIELNKKL